MSSTFTVSTVVDMAKEKDWAANLGMMDWDTTRIVFTKRGLLEFLRYTGTTVDTNFSNIQKLPKFATFGNLSAEKSEVVVAQDPAENKDSSAETSAPTEAAVAAVGEYKPSRRVRTAPGGPTSDIFGNAVDDGVLATAPRKGETQEQEKDNNAAQGVFGKGEEPFKPTRRVRERPGGTDHISELF